jgi:SNF2 family DNA or RNA helicase
LRAVEREFVIWGTALDAQFMTYEGMTKRVKHWVNGEKSPPYVVFDESSKLKSHTSQRSQAAQALADGARRDWGADSKVILMTGTPAPKDPGDWWSQCEIACPGFLKEGDIHKFKNRLGVIVQKERFDGGGVYPSLITWRNDTRKCNVCGLYKEEPVHNSIVAGLVGDDPDAAHTFVESVNEIEYLYKRMQGLVVVYFKKDCLDLPDKVYRPIHVEPTQSTLRAAKLIPKAAKTVIEGLTRLRELSDGFQYIKEKNGKKPCERCEGKGEVLLEQEIPDTCPNCKVHKSMLPDGVTEVLENVCGEHIPKIDRSYDKCPHCKGTGDEDRFVRNVKEVPCPKEQALIDLLDEYDDVGRVVIYAGFTAAIDRCVRICQKQGWHVIRIDQGKELVIDEQGRHLTTKDYLTIFQDQKDEYPRVAFIAHPGSAGMGLTLTASPVIIYYSNDFNGEYRTQSEDRIHRPGMDLNLGATIIDIIHLPSDQKVIDNLKAKRNLELMSLGELNDVLKQGEGHESSTR